MVGIEEKDETNLMITGHPILGIVLNLDNDSIGIIVIEKWSSDKQMIIREGALIHGVGLSAKVPVGLGFLSRIVGALHEPIDGRGPIVASSSYPIERPAPTIIERRSVCEPLRTGTMAIDTLIPIGHGQRELIIGDRQTGKTSLAVTAMISQVPNVSTLSIYVAIGQKASSVASVVGILNAKRTRNRTVIVAANASDSATRQYLAPYSATALAEYYMLECHRSVLIIYDDLTKHAYAYRQISLLLKRPPGREAYPGDIFYVHSRLLERSAKLSKSSQSITSLPIVETQAGDVSSYIPTNVISITDGQIFLSSDLFNAGIIPAINVGISVSRVGSAAQTRVIKKGAGQLKLKLAQFEELEKFSKYSSDIDKKVQVLINKGKRLRECLKQRLYDTRTLSEQALILFGLKEEWFDKVPLEKLEFLLLDWIMYRFQKVPRYETLKGIGTDPVLGTGIVQGIQDFYETEIPRGIQRIANLELWS